MSEKPISPLRQRMIEDMSVRNFVEKTRNDYIRHVCTFTAFLGRWLMTSSSRRKCSRRRNPRGSVPTSAGQLWISSADVSQRTAMGETVEPVAPLILSGVMMKANSCTFLLKSSSSLRFSRRCTPFTTSAI